MSVKQVSLQQIRVVVKLAARIASVLLRHLTQKVFRQMGQHVFPLLKKGIALGTVKPRALLQTAVALVGLKVTCQVLAKRLEVLQGSSALTTEQSTCRVVVFLRFGVFSQVCWFDFHVLLC